MGDEQAVVGVDQADQAAQVAVRVVDGVVEDPAVVG
jgi:hypothetical protein